MKLLLPFCFDSSYHDPGYLNLIGIQWKIECLDVYKRQAHQRIKDLTFSICKAFNATCDIDIQIGYPCLINNPGLTEQLIQIGSDYLGGGNVERLESRLTSEDFAYYSQKIPAVFYRLGVGQVPGVHRSDFDIDESAIAYGAGTMAYLAMSL